MTASFESADTRLRWAAIAAFWTHALAGLLMLSVLSQGLASNPNLNSRMAFIAGHTGRWRAAWLSWSAAAVSILLLSVMLARVTRSRDPSRAALATFAPFVATAAVLADLSAQVVATMILPEFARGAEVARFQHFDRIITSLSGGLANALYTLAISLLAWAARARLPRYASVAAVMVALSGAVLTVAAFVGSPRGMVWSNVVLVPALLAWLWGVSSAARTLR